jgi:steroid 5-alpha reductase family enzyme
LLSPVVITLLIIKVTGVELLEKKYKDNPEYQEYILKTSSFIPLPPKK